MANFFGKDFPGRCFYLEFPSNTNEIFNLVASVTCILKTLSCPLPQDASSIDEAFSSLEGGLQRHQSFLAIDNVWEKSFDYAERIMCMKGMTRSKLLLAGRSKELVTRLLQSRVACMQMQPDMHGNESACAQYSALLSHPIVRLLKIPSLTEDEAIEALRSYSCFSRFIPVDCLRSLARSCFFREQCHPLYLRLKGTELRKKGRASFNDQKWKDLISESQCTAAHVNDTEQAVLQILGKSLDECSLFVQKVFIDLVTCELLADSYSDIESLIMLLRVLHYEQLTENAIRCQVLNVLEFHGLVEIEPSQIRFNKSLVIHDLNKQLGKSRFSSGVCYGFCGLAACLYSSQSAIGEDLSVVSAQKVMASK
ncbi:hypothetical protein L7F22_061649 [Adiantum nelumboides]|nr:hypothetical protein [Adiantum nelumboides]